MGVPQDGAHLATREIQHPAPRGVLDEHAGSPLSDERGERPAVPHEVTSRALEISDIGHRPIIAAGRLGVPAEGPTGSARVIEREPIRLSKWRCA